MARTLKQLVPLAASSDYQACIVTSAEFAGTPMVNGEAYLYTCSVASYIKQGATPTAAAADGSMYVPADFPVFIDGGEGAKLALIRVGGSDGVATLQKMTVHTF